MVLARERREQVEILRIDRPEARNAINPAVSEAIDAALDDAEADPAVRAVVLTGTGPVFSAGADLKELARGGGQRGRRRRGRAGPHDRRQLAARGPELPASRPRGTRSRRARRVGARARARGGGARVARRARGRPRVHREAGARMADDVTDAQPGRA